MAAPKKVTLEDIDKQLKSMFRSWKRQIKEIANKLTHIEKSQKIR